MDLKGATSVLDAAARKAWFPFQVQVAPSGFGRARARWGTCMTCACMRMLALAHTCACTRARAIDMSPERR